MSPRTLAGWDLSHTGRSINCASVGRRTRVCEGTYNTPASSTNVLCFEKRTTSQMTMAMGSYHIFRIGVFNKLRALTKLSKGQGSDQNWEPPVLLLANQPYTPSIEWLYDECYDATRVWSLNPQAIRGGLYKDLQFHNNDLHLSKSISCQGKHDSGGGGERT